MVFKRQLSSNIEHIQQQQQQESENSSIIFVATPTGRKHFRRQLSERNYGKACS